MRYRPSVPITPVLTPSMSVGQVRCYSLDTDLHTSAEAGDPGSVSVTGLRYSGGGQCHGQPGVYPVLPPGLYTAHTLGGQPPTLLSGEHF